MTKNTEKLSPSPAQRSVTIVREMVAMFRRRGLKSQHAMPEVAQKLGMSITRLRNLFYMDTWRVRIDADEAERLTQKYADYIDQEIAALLQMADDLRVKKQQLALDLECGNQSYAGPSFGSCFPDFGSVSAA